MSDIAAIRNGLYTILSTNVTGLTAASNVFKYAPSNPPDTFPFGFLEMRQGVISRGGEQNTPARFAGIRDTEHRVHFTLCFSLQSDLADAEKNAEGFVQLVVAAIDQHKGLNGTAFVSDAAVESYEVVEVALVAGGQKYYGVRFVIWVNEVETGALVGA